MSHRSTIRLGVAVFACVSALLLSGCSSETPTPSPSKSPASEQEIDKDVPVADVGDDPVFPAPTSTPSKLEVKATPGGGDERGDEPSLELAPFTPEEEVWAATQKPLGDAAYIAESRYSDDYSYGYFSEDGKTFFIGFRKAAPGEVIEALKATALPFVVEENLGYNAADTQRVVELMANELRPPDGSSATVGASLAANLGHFTIKVTVGSPDKSDVTWVQERLAKIALPEGYSVVVETSPELAELAGYGRAAGTWLLQSGNGTCTSAFVVQRNSDLALGVLTAGHCPASLSYYNAANGEHYALTNQGGTFDGNGDTRFLQSHLMMDAWFHAGNYEGRPVLDARNAYLNEQGVCRYGRQSNYGACGTLTGSNQNIWINSSGVATLIGSLDTVNVAGTIPGDSGGSVYGGNTAFGIISSKTASLTYFTRISAATAATGTRVCRDVVCR